MDIIGFLNVDKPVGITSHDVVKRIRRLLNIKKIGHTGTLDPLATGVLVLCLGRATRLIQFLDESEKVYHTRIRLGIETDTNDREGTPVRQTDPSIITYEAVEAACRMFVGEMQQVPPMYSAIKKNGTRLYKLARAGETVDREPRTVRIDEIRIVSFHNPMLALSITCSRGTYIRSLAHDLGHTLNCGAHLDQLRRTRSGPFTIDSARTLEEIADLHRSDRLPVIKPGEALSHLRIIRVNEEAARKICRGMSLTEKDVYEGLSEMANAKGHIQVYDCRERLLAIGDVINKTAPQSASPTATELHPRIVLETG